MSKLKISKHERATLRILGRVLTEVAKKNAMHCATAVLLADLFSILSDGINEELGKIYKRGTK